MESLRELQGIGAAIARNLSAGGMRLVLAARTRDRLEEIAGGLPAESEIAPCEVVEPGSAEFLLHTAQNRFGAVHALINNAGVLAMGNLDEADLDELCHMIRVNLEAVVRTSYVFDREFKTKGSGSIVNLSSIAAFGVRPTLGVYAAAKGAVESFTSAPRVELGQFGVKVGCIAPGSTQTEMLNSFRSNLGVSADRASAQAEDIASAVHFMLEQPVRANVEGIRIYSTLDVG